MVINKKPLSECNEIKNFYGIDVTKFICALLVVAIHIAPFGLNEKYNWPNYIVQEYLARIAVPFFFISSGFLFFRKIDKDSFSMAKAFKHVLKLIRLYIIWTLIYGYFIIEDMKYRGQGMVRSILMFVKNFVLTGSYLHLWYLPAVIFAISLILILLYKKCPVEKIVIFAAIFYFMGLFAQSYFGLIAPLRKIEWLWTILRLTGKIINTTRDGLFEGFFFVGIGMLIAYKPICMKFRSALIGFFISMILLFAETITVRYLGWNREQDMYVMLVPSTFFLFYFVSHLELKEREVYINLRFMSNLIYYVHLLIRDIILILFGLNNFILTVIVIIICSMIIIKLSNTKKFGWLKKVYM